MTNGQNDHLDPQLAIDRAKGEAVDARLRAILDASREREAREKRCRHCERTLPIENFRPDPKLKDGIASWCRDCFAARNRQYRAERGAEINARRRAAYQPTRKQATPIHSEETP